MALLVQIDAESAEQSAAQVADLNNRLNPAGSTTPPVEPRRRGKKPSVTGASEATEMVGGPVVEEAPAAPAPTPVAPELTPVAQDVDPLSDAPAAPAPAPKKALTLDDCKAAAQGILDAKGVEKGKAELGTVIKKFGVQRVSELTQEKFADFITACQLSAKA